LRISRCFGLFGDLRIPCAEKGSLNYGLEYAGLRLEQGIDGRSRNTGGRCDFTDGYLFDAMRGEKLLGSVENALARAKRALGSQLCVVAPTRPLLAIHIRYSKLYPM